MPCFAVFGAPAEIGLCINTAVFEPEQTVCVERGVESHIEAAVAVEIYGVLAVALKAFFVSDET